MASQIDIVQTLREKPDGLLLNDIAGALGVKPFGITKTISDLKKKNWIDKDDTSQLYTLTEEGRRASEATIEPVVSTEGELPLEYDKFKGIGDSLGLKDPFLTSVCDYVFALGSEDITKVYEGLLRLSLRPDVVQRWVALWSTFLNKPMPRQVAEATVAATGSVPPSEKKWIIISNRPVPDEAGLYTFNQALQVIESQGIKIPEGQTVLEKQFEALNTRFDKMVEAMTNQEIQSVRREVESLKENLSARPLGRTDMDVISEITAGGLNELRGLRGDVKGFFQSQALPPSKSPEQREQRKTHYRGQLKVDAEIEALGRHLWFNEPMTPEMEQQIHGKRLPQPAPQPSQPEQNYE